MIPLEDFYSIPDRENLILYLVNTDKIFGLIPCVTANLLAANLGINSISKALKVIDRKNVRKIDVMTVNDKLCVLRCGMGYDADIIWKTPQSLKNKFGYFAYLVAGIIFALRLIPKTYYITFENKSFSTDATCIMIGNASNMYKNIISLANNSELDDGHFEVFILTTKNPITFFYEFLRIIIGKKK